MLLWVGFEVPATGADRRMMLLLILSAIAFRFVVVATEGATGAADGAAFVDTTEGESVLNSNLTDSFR